MLQEDDNYYPFGLTMAEISSKAFKSNYAENRRKFNDGTELNTDFDVNLYETQFRSLDPQKGRFWQVDPLCELAEDISPYAYVMNNPLLYNDPLGLDTTRTTQRDSKIEIKKDPKKGDVVSIDNGEGSVSHYTYDPENENANQ